jgi:hypothetical protein
MATLMPVSSVVVVVLLLVVLVVEVLVVLVLVVMADAEVFGGVHVPCNRCFQS